MHIWSINEIVKKRPEIGIAEILPVSRVPTPKTKKMTFVITIDNYK